MNALLLLGSCTVALEHIVKSEFTAAYAGGEQLEEDPDTLSDPRPAQLDLTLTSVHMETYTDYDGDPRGFASASDHMVLHGEVAEKLESFIRNRAFDFGTPGAISDGQATAH